MDGARVLLVEDEEFMALDLEARLEGIGLTVVARADNGAAALQEAAEHKPDLALLDIMIIGDMDGVETGRRLAELGIPVVYLTAHTEIDTIRRAAATGPYGFLTKPVQTIELLASITVALAKARIERELRAQEQRLIAEQDQLLALIGHEIRTPVAIIQAAADSLRLLDQEPPEPERERRYQRITNSARRIDAMIALASRRDSRSAFAGDNPAPVDLLVLSHEVLAELGPAERQRLSFETSEGTAMVFVGLELMRFVLVNLLDNAFKYAPPGSVITVRLRQLALSDEVCWSISDQGPGVAEAERERIFEKFYRCPQQSSAPGLGLGLYIARSTILRFGGRLDYVAPAGAGACLAITLPLWVKGQKA
jgi:signal transduction histidine kinase